MELKFRLKVQHGISEILIFWVRIKKQNIVVSGLFLITALPRKEIHRKSAMSLGQQISLKFYLNSMWNKIKNKQTKTEEEKLLSMLQFYQTFRYIKAFSFWPYLNEAIT